MAKHVHLGSGHPKAGHDSQSTRTAIGASGVINPNDAPAKVVGHNGDIFIWFFENNSNVQIQVELPDNDFLIKDWPWDPKGKNPPASPMFAWKTSNPVVIDAGKSGVIVGKGQYPFPALPPLFVAYSYTISVKNTMPTLGSAFDIDYDPDGEIKP